MDLRLKLCQLANYYRDYQFRCCRRDMSTDGYLEYAILAKEIVFARDGLSSFNVANNVPHSDQDTWLSKDRVWIDSDGLHISSIYKTATHLWGDGAISTHYESGRVDTRGLIEQINGIWVVRAKMPPSFPALWTMKSDHSVEGYEKQQIIPEVDFAEVIKGFIKQSVHYGYYNDDSGYTKHSIGNSVFPVDDKFHEYAVEFLDDGYKFYIDGYLTTKYISNDPEFVNRYPNYLIMNNAMKSDSINKSYTELIVESIRHYI